MSKTLAVKTAEEFPRAIGLRVVAFKEKCASVAKLQVEVTNEAREIGLLAMEWCGHQQLTLGFFEAHKRELPKEASFKLLNCCAAIARRMPGPAKQVEDARRLWQPTFQAVGLLSEPERDGQQLRRALTPFVEFVNEVGRLRELLMQWNRDQPFDDWNDETRASVKQQLQPLVDFYNGL